MDQNKESKNATFISGRPAYDREGNYVGFRENKQ